MHLSLLSLLTVVPYVLAVRLKFDARKTGPAPSTVVSDLGSKASDDSFGFENVNSILGADIYVASLSVDGKDFEVCLILLTFTSVF